MSGLREISLVIVPVSDQSESITFYVDKLGLEKRTDQEFGPGLRWVEVFAPEGTTGISLATPPQGREVTPRETGITFQTDDIDATHAHFRDAGVDVDADVTRMGGPIPDMFWLRDPDGHSMLVVQPVT